MADDANDKHPGSGLEAVGAALSYGGKIYNNPSDFDAALDHVKDLLKDAFALYERGSFATAAFLAITAIEETGKAHVAVFRKEGLEGAKPKGRDPLRDHRSKHRMAILPTVLMSARIVGASGHARADALQREAQDTGFVEAREAALYFAQTGGGFVTPRMVISRARARELLLLAIEAADDALVGYTNNSFDVGRCFEMLFASIIGSDSQSTPS